ncbi:MAG: T9SS C-terminal target domain-containing protein [Balneola sp.]|nr:MAG: T9SS C-terminal target domain-containing protein [Balneola sp.]
MKTLKTLCTLLLLSLLTVSGFSQDFLSSEQPEAVENQLFGFSVSVGEWNAIATAPQKDIGDKKAVGSAFFYIRMGENWEIQQEVSPDGLPSSSNFGLSSKISFDQAFIGSLGSENGILMQESVFVYQPNDTSWIHTQTLRPNDAKMGSRFGSALDMNRIYDLSVIGAYQADGNDSKSGAAYIFELENNEWIQTAKLVASDGEANDFFGHSVLLLSENLVAVGAYNATGASERSGAVYIFEKDMEGNWSQAAKLYDPNGSSSDLFGYSLAKQLQVFVLVKDAVHDFHGALFVGTPGSNNPEGVQTGSVYFFNKDNEQWFMSTEFFDETSGANDHFGISIAQSDLAGLLIGANRSGFENEGKIHHYGIYETDGFPNDFEVFSFPGNSENSEYYGTRVSTGQSGDILISSPFTTVDGLENVGHVEFYAYELLSTDEPLGEVIEYKLDQNYPNPFNPNTTISYQVRDAGNVTLTVFNILGQAVQVLVDEYKVNGTYNARFDASGLASGFYFYTLEVNDFTSTKKMMLIK